MWGHRKSKRIDSSLKEKEKERVSFKAKKVEFFNYGGLRNMTTDCPSSKDIKKKNEKVISHLQWH